MAPLPPNSDTPQQQPAAPFNLLLLAAASPFGRRLPSKPSIPGRANLDALQLRLGELLRRIQELTALPFLDPLFSFQSRLRCFSQSRCRVATCPSPLSNHCFAAVLGDSAAGLVVANGINSFLSIYNTLLVVRLVLTWFPNTPPAIVSPLSTICDPYLNIFRGIIPPLGGTLDLSPILAFLVLNVFTSTAAALPAELPVTTTLHQDTAPDPMPLSLTTTQRKWMKRIHSNRSKQAADAH